jgi:hypothetical protein
MYGIITTGDAHFAECRGLCWVLSDTRQNRPMPSVWHSAKCGTRQRPSLLSATLGKLGPRQKRRQVMAEATHGIKLCQVLGLSTRQSILLCRVPQPGTRQGPLCRVSEKALGKDFFLNFDFKFFSIVLVYCIEAHVWIWNFLMTFWYIF